MRVGRGFGKWRAVTWLGMIAATLVVLAACGGDDDTPADDRPDTQPTTEATAEAPEQQAPEELAISDVVWTTEVDPDTREPQDDVTSYSIDSPSIIAAVHVEDLPAGAELTATWTIDGTEVPDATMTATADTAFTDAWVTFQFLRDDGRRFPLGILEVTITGSDGSEIRDEVEITLP